MSDGAPSKDAPVTCGPSEQLRIKAVAAHIASSSNPARFQAELAAACRNNPNFAFLLPEHPHNDWAQYCVSIYSKAHSAAQRRNIEMQQNMLQQQQQQQMLQQQQQQQQNRSSGAQQPSSSSSLSAASFFAGGQFGGATVAQPFYGDYAGGANASGNTLAGLDNAPTDGSYNNNSSNSGAYGLL